MSIDLLPLNFHKNLIIKGIAKAFSLRYNQITNIGGRNMAYFINTDCINCGACVPECPVSCISEGDSVHVIDENACIDCGACNGVCPTGAPNAQ